MSALGQKATFAVQTGMSALPPKADIRYPLRESHRALKSAIACSWPLPPHHGALRREQQYHFGCVVFLFWDCRVRHSKVRMRAYFSTSSLMIIATSSLGIGVC